MSEGLAFDHVIIGVRDLDTATERLWEEHGLRASAGGVHPGGTKNVAARFADDTYLELLAVDDANLPMGKWLDGIVAEGDRLVGWAVRTSDIDAVAARLGEEISHGSIDMPDGSRGSWRTVWSRRLESEPYLPFFIQYDRGPEHAQRVKEASSLHRGKPSGIAWVEIGGDPASMSEWLAGAPLDVRFGDGEPGLVAIGVATADGEVVVR